MLDVVYHLTIMGVLVAGLALARPATSY